MSQQISILVVMLCALVAANLPFATTRLFGLVSLKRRKSLAIRLGELLVSYGVVGGVGLLLEKHAGQIAPQGWEFYAVTSALFLTLAFPGFVYRYLLRRHG